MRVLHFYPWGNFYPATCGSDFVACNQLDYLQARNCEVDCLMPREFGRGLGDLSRLYQRFPCVRSVRLIDVVARKFTLRDVLFALEQSARSAEFRTLASEPFDIFLANYVLSAPLASALQRSVFKVVETVDILAGMFRTIELLKHASPPSPLIQALEERFLFQQLELDLYRAFDRALMISVQETEAVRAGGYSSAVYVPQPFPVAPGEVKGQGPFQFDLVFVGSENHLNTHGLLWFYRYVFVPYLRRHGVRLAVAGRVCEKVDVEDALLSKLGFMNNLEELYSTTKLVVVPIFEGTGTAIKLHEALAAGRAVVSTPVGCRGIDPSSGALACVDMKEQPRRTAEVILDLLRNDNERKAMQRRAIDLMTRLHSRDAYLQAMDSVFECVFQKHIRPAA